jgi:hypothetical protein
MYMWHLVVLRASTACQPGLCYFDWGLLQQLVCCASLLVWGFLVLLPACDVQVELLGANIAANGSREQMSYTIDCLRRWGHGVESPRLRAWLHAKSIQLPAATGSMESGCAPAIAGSCVGRACPVGD